MRLRIYLGDCVHAPTSIPEDAGEVGDFGQVSVPKSLAIAEEQNVTIMTI
jgi:hypothetical protein